MKKSEAQVQQDLLRPLFEAGGAYWLAVVLAGSLVLAGVCTLLYQFYTGIGVWGLNSPVFWAFDITNFVFWIGISHAGTLISAILRLANATWRRPVTRCAEAITVFALSIGAIIVYVRAQEFHIRTNKVTLWFDLRSSLSVQLQRFREFLKTVPLDQAKEYVDLRIADKIIYK